MANTGFKGLDVRQTGNQLVFRTFLQDGSGAIVTSGTTNLYIYELQSDGTLKSYDFNDNTFKTTALTTEVQAMTHRTGNNAGTNTGIWTYALSTLTGFTNGGMYFARVKNTGASPTDQVREFQYGSYQGDVTMTAGSTGVGYVQGDTTKWLAGTIPAVNVTGVPLVDLKYTLGTISPAAAGYVGLDWGQVTNKTTTNALTGTTIATTQQVDVNTIKTQTVTCTAGVTVGAFVGNATAALGVDASGRVDLGKILGTASAGAAGYVGLDWGHVNAPTTTVALTGTTIATTQQVDVNTIKTQTVTCAAGVTVNANLGTTQPLNFTGTAGSALVKSDVVDVAGSAVSTSTAQLGVNVVNWGGTATSGTIPPDAVFARSGTAQAGSTSTTIKLDSGASATDNFYANQIVFLRGGTGAGQSATIASYAGTTKVATIVGTWATTPDNTTTFTIEAAGAPAAAAIGVVSANVTQWNSSAVATPNVAGYPLVDLKYVLGTISPATAGFVGVDWAHVNAPTSTVGLTNTTISTSQTVNSVTSAVSLPANPPAGFLVAASFGANVLPTNFNALAIDTGGNVKIQSGFKKNTALNGFQFYMALSSDHLSPATGKTITATRSIDGGAFAACTNNASEVGSGWYEINFSASDLNGTSIGLSFAASGCDTTLLTVITQP
jgi:hypothetical protein